LIFVSLDGGLAREERAGKGWDAWNLRDLVPLLSLEALLDSDVHMGGLKPRISLYWLILLFPSR
jgi:hypothetical protein